MMKWRELMMTLTRLFSLSKSGVGDSVGIEDIIHPAVVDEGNQIPCLGMLDIDFAVLFHIIVQNYKNLVTFPKKIPHLLNNCGKSTTFALHEALAELPLMTAK